MGSQEKNRFAFNSIIAYSNEIFLMKSWYPTNYLIIRCAI